MKTGEVVPQATIYRCMGCGQTKFHDSGESIWDCGCDGDKVVDTQEARNREAERISKILRLTGMT